MARLGDICEKKIDTIKAAYKGDIDYVDISSIDNQRKIITQIQSMSIEDAPSRAKQLVFPGDILVSTVRPNLNAVALITKNTDNALVASTGYCVLRCLPNADNKYVFYFCQSPTFIEKLVVQATGASYPAVTSAIVRECALPFPPLEEQRKIAAVLDKVSDLMSKRRQQLDKLDELVKSRFVEMFGAYTETARLSDVATISGGLTKSTKRDKLPLRMPYLRVANVSFASIDVSEMLSIGLTDEEYSKTLLQRGDLLFVEGNGSPDQIGRVAIWENQVIPCVHQNHLIKSRFNKELVIPSFAMYYFMSSKGREQIKGKAVSTSGLYTLSVSKISDLMLPTPPLDLQKQFAAFIAYTNKLKLAVQKSLEKLEILKKALMQEYFG